MSLPEERAIAPRPPNGAPPYERPPLSKGFLAGAEDRADLLINDPDFYATHGIDLRLNTYVTALDLRGRLLRDGRLVAAFVMDRPEEERTLAAAGIAERRTVSAAEIGDEQAPLEAVVA